MTERTKIERVGEHLLIEGGSYTGEDNCHDVAFPIASLRVENRNARSVFIWSEGDPFRVPNVIAHSWTAREILEVAYGGGTWLHHPQPQADAEKTIADLRATVKAHREEIAVLREALASLQNFVRLDAPACRCDSRGVTAEEAFEAARMLCGLSVFEPDASRAIAVYTEAAKVGR